MSPHLTINVWAEPESPLSSASGSGIDVMWKSKCQPRHLEFPELPSSVVEAHFKAIKVQWKQSPATVHNHLQCLVFAFETKKIKRENNWRAEWQLFPFGFSSHWKVWGEVYLSIFYCGIRLFCWPTHELMHKVYTSIAWDTLFLPRKSFLIMNGWMAM